MNNQYRWYPIVGRDLNLRAGDADRERVAERLRESHAEGRLDMAEFQDRAEHCYEAKTLGELSKLVKDLPKQDERDERRPFEPRRRRLAPLAPILIALIVVSTATGHHVLWLWIPLVFFVSRSNWRRRRWVASGRRGPDDWI